MVYEEFEKDSCEVEAGLSEQARGCARSSRVTNHDANGNIPSAPSMVRSLVGGDS